MFFLEVSINSEFLMVYSPWRWRASMKRQCSTGQEIPSIRAFAPCSDHVTDLHKRHGNEHHHDHHRTVLT